MSLFVNRSESQHSSRLRSAANRSQRIRRAAVLESLERRELLAANLDIVAGQLLYNGSAVNNNLNVSVSSPSGSGNYVFTDTGETINLSANAIGLGWVGSGTNTVTGPDGSVDNILIDTDGGVDTITAVSNTDPVSIDTAAGFPGERINIGDPVAGTVAGINGDIFVQDSGGQGAVFINDQNDSASRVVSFDNTQTISGALPGGHTIGFGSGVGTTSADPFVYNGPFGGNTITVNTPTMPATGFFLRINSGNGDDTVNVAALAAGTDLDINTQNGIGDAVHIGSDGTLADILGSISVQDSGGVGALTVSNSASGAAQTVGINNGTITGATAVAITYQPGVTTLTYNGGSGGDTVNVNLPTNDDLDTLNVNTNDGDDTVNVLAVNAGLTANIGTGAGINDRTNIGSTAPNQATGILAPIAGVVNVDDSSGLASLDVSDVGNAVPTSYTITPTQITGSSFAGTINYGANIDNLTVSGGSGGNILSITGTAANTTTVNTGNGRDDTTVKSTAAGTTLNLHGQAGLDVVTIGNLGDISGVQGAIFIENAFGFDNITVNDSNGVTSRDYNLSGESDSTLTATGIAPITYNTFDADSLTVLAGGGDDTLTVDFNTGNPIPITAGPGFGLTFNGGGGASNVLNLVGDLPAANGGPFVDEVHNANGAGEGDITFTGSNGTDTSIAYTGLTPVNDVVVVANLTFNDHAFPDGSFIIEDGNDFGGFETGQIRSVTTPTSFETTNFANKTNVTLNTANFFFGYNGTINLPTQPTGLANLTVNTITGQNDNINAIATPPGVTTNVNTGTGSDIVNVTGTGIAAGTTTNLDGGAGNFDTLNYDAGGLVPTITTGPAPGQINITLPGAGTVTAVNFESIRFTNLGPLIITPGAARTINSVEGFQLVDAIVSSFTVGPVPVVLPPGVTLNGPPASEFNASIDWGDPSVNPDAGTIIQDASDPSIYYVKGTHTYTSPGTFTAASTIDSNGNALTATINGVTVSFQFDALDDAPLADATVNVSNASIAVAAFPIAGVEGSTIAAGPIANFTDAGGANGNADPASDFLATIIILNQAGTPVLTLPAASITQNGNSNVYTVNAPAIDLGSMFDPGTYSVRVTVIKTVNAGSVTSTGSSTLTVADAPLTPAAVQPSVDVTERVRFSGSVAAFIDANPFGAIGDFSNVSIDWGDGSPASAGSVSQPGGPGTAFIVSGTHTYLDSGVASGFGQFPITVNVRSKDGQSVTIHNTANVADVPIVLTGQLDRASDTGVSNTDAITNDSTPTFFGNSAPLSTITLTATPTGGGAAFVIGSTTTDSAGFWTIVSSFLNDGSYTITARAVDSVGFTIATTQILPNSSQGPLVIDTVGSKVTNVVFDRLSGQIIATFQDDRSGMSQVSLVDANNYSLVRNNRSLRRFLVTSLATSGVGTDPVPVSIGLNGGARIRGGRFRFTAFAKNGRANGIQDVAGNALDGEFYGSFPSGNNVRGGNFVARVNAFHNRVLPPATLIGTVRPGLPGGPAALRARARKDK